MKRQMLIFAIAAEMNAGIALAQHEKMPGHESMSPGDHAKHEKKDGNADKKQPFMSNINKKDADSDKKRPPKSNEK